MTVIDLSHKLHRGMPLYPGTEEPAFVPVHTHIPDLFRETRLVLTSHTGTHVDAPFHILPDGPRLEDLPAEQFVGRAVVIECRGCNTITLQQVLAHPQAEQAEFLLFRTGWDRFWGQEAYFSGYPCADARVVDYVLATGKKGIGLDTISLDPVNSIALHRRLLAGGKQVILENLTGLDRLPEGLFTLCALPLNFPGSDGSPVRAVALLEEAAIF